MLCAFVNFLHVAITVVKFFDSVCFLCNLRKAAMFFAVMLCKPKTVFHFKQLRFGALNGVAHSLAGNALILGNLRK